MHRAACTVIARNYIPYARVLGESLRGHHADIRLVALLLDDVGCDVLDASSEPFDVWRPRDLDIPTDDLARMASIYDAKELATALKAALIRGLLAAGAEAVLFLDPDILVLDRLDDLWELSASHGVTLIPHSLRPFPSDGRTPSDRHLRRTGIFNGGYVGVGPAGHEFLAWWDDRLRRYSIVDKPEGLFFDQRWLDFVPSYFPHLILRDPTIDVAYWNLHDRRLDFDGQTYTIENRPLRFFHFSGFDPMRPDLLTRVADRFVAVRHPALEPLCREYAERLLEAGYCDYIGLCYAPEGGAPADSLERRLQREALLAAEAAQQTPDVQTSGRVDGRSGSAGGKARALLAVGPDFAAGRPLARALGWLARRVWHPFVEYQVGVNRAMLEAVREGDDSIRAEIAALDARLTALEQGRDMPESRSDAG